jgi:hypothetical protein
MEMTGLEPVWFASYHSLSAVSGGGGGEIFLLDSRRGVRCVVFDFSIFDFWLP